MLFEISFVIVLFGKFYVYTADSRKQYEVVTVIVSYSERNDVLKWLAHFCVKQFQYNVQRICSKKTVKLIVLHQFLELQKKNELNISHIHFKSGFTSLYYVYTRREKKIFF